MTILTENLVISKTRAQDLNSVHKLNCWGSNLTDVSLVRNMTNVEVLALSVNHITTLADFAYCYNLRELSLRRNEIQDITEVSYLKSLPRLTSLWLAENPCAEHPNYRLTVLRAIPHLERLDDIYVQPEELEKAQMYGDDLTLSPTESSQPEQEGNEKPHQDQPKVCTREEMTEERAEAEESSPTSLVLSRKQDLVSYMPSTSTLDTTQADKRKVVPNVDCFAKLHVNTVNTSHAQEDLAYLSDEDHQESHDATSIAIRNRFGILPKGGKHRSSNILSAVLCLIKELDCQSLEVVDTAVHCQMEHLERSLSSLS